MFASLASCRHSPGFDSATQSTLTQPHVRGGSTNVAFAVVSDTHVGFGEVVTTHRALVAQLKGIEGRRYPKETEGIWPSRSVPPLRGLLIAGDLTEAGTEAQWEQFEQIYGFPREDGQLRIPTFEVIGNHDRWGGSYVADQVARRHGGNFYSFDWDKVHFLALGEAPDDEGLAFVENDLATVPPAAPLIVYFHLPLAGSEAHGWWFADGDYPDRLARLLQKRTVLAFFHGHAHSTDHYRWRGYDVFRPGAVKEGTPDFAVTHITDHMFTVATFNYVSGNWVGTFAKSWN